MNWDAFGAIGELVGAAAVVVSLLYLSLQMKANRRGLQASTRDSVFRQLQEFNYVVMADPGLADIFHRGAADMDSLDQVEKARFLHTAYSFFKVFENIYLHHLDGTIPDELWEENRPVMVLYGTQPGGRAYWEQRRDAYDGRFVTILEQMEDSTLRPPQDLKARSDA